MKALVVEDIDQLAWRDWPDPSELRPGEALIRTAYVGLCATDLALIHGEIRRGAFPKVLGHEWSGTVARVSSAAEEHWIGRRVVGENHITCMGCPACREGHWNTCPHAQEVGFELPGGYGEYFVTQISHLHTLPDSVSLEEATLMEPLSVALYGMERAELRAGERVAVFGDGPIGLLCVQLAQTVGASEVILIGGRPGRLDLGARLGASKTMNYHQVNAGLGNALLDRFGPVDVCVEASGSIAALEAGLYGLSFDGRMVVLGDYGKHKWTMAPSILLHKNGKIIASNANAGTWHRALTLVATGRVQLKELVSAVFSIEEYRAAFDLAEHSSDAVKVVLEHEAQ